MGARGRGVSGRDRVMSLRLLRAEDASGIPRKKSSSSPGGTGGMLSRLGNIAAETGMWKLCTQGLAARCVMIGTLTAGQFGIFDIVMNAVGASKFHFHDPSKPADH